MAGRAYWKGYLKLSLVSCPVKLYPATSCSAGKISFNLLHKDTLNRVQQRYHDPELGEIDRADLVKGYQFEKDRYVVVTNEELDEIEIESTKTIDIDGFVDAGDIDPIYHGLDLLSGARRADRGGDLRRDPRGDEDGRTRSPSPASCSPAASGWSRSSRSPTASA